MTDEGDDWVELVVLFHREEAKEWLLRFHRAGIDVLPAEPRRYLETSEAYDVNSVPQPRRQLISSSDCYPLMVRPENLEAAQRLLRGEDDAG